MAEKCMQIVGRTWAKSPFLPPQARSDGERGGAALCMETLRECFHIGALQYLGPFLKATKFGKGASKLTREYFHSRA